MAKLSVKDLSINFGGLKALSGITLDLREGEIVGLMGPNGAGKTTLVNCISRVYDPSSGEMSYGEQDLRKKSGDEIVSLGIARTFQDLNFFNLIQELPVIDYLKLGQFARVQGSVLGQGFQFRGYVRQELEMQRKARRILEFFREMREKLESPEEERGYPILSGRGGFPDLIDVEYEPIGSLSFAWRRRLDLARALASGPKVLLLDEPAQGLPPSEIENLSRTLKLIREEFNLSMLIVEHSVGMLMSICDRIVAMNAGEKIAEGIPAEIRTNPKVIESYLGTGDKRPAARVSSASKSTDGETKPVLVANGIDLFYGLAQALYSVSIVLRPAEITCLLGTNGSGKSTLLKALSGAEKIAFGDIWMDGEYMPSGWPERAVELGIQYVPQGHLIFPELTVMENLRLGGYILEKRGVDISANLERVLGYFPQLRAVLREQGASLSGGLQQMVAIAQALMAKPKVLLLDEPSLGLAPVMVETIFSIIETVRAQEMCSVLIAEQNVVRALEISDYVYMLSTGVVVGHGASDKFRADEKLVMKNLGFS